MKYIIIGLGNFGSILAARLTQMGHEVIGVDNRKTRVDELRDSLSSTICMDSADVDALKTLPLNSVDVIVVAIGENFAASIQTVALLRQLGADHIVARALSNLHRTVLESIGVERVIFPEQDAAEVMAQSFELNGFQNSYRIDRGHYVMRFTIPESLSQGTIAESGIQQNGLQLLAVIRKIEEKNAIGVKGTHNLAIEDISPEQPLQPGDVMVIYGTLTAYNAFTKSIRQ